MLPERDREALRDMLAHAQEALEQARNYQRRDLDRQRLVYLGLQHLVAIIGEAATRVSSETQQNHPELPWTQMIAMRNRLIHGYEVVKADIVWDTLVQDLPILVEQLRAILAGSTPPPSDDSTAGTSAHHR